MMPTVGPMTCQGCGGRVWWAQRRFLVPVGDGWRKHTCKPTLASRAYWATARQSVADIRAYNREWMRRRRAAA